MILVMLVNKVLNGFGINVLSFVGNLYLCGVLFMGVCRLKFWKKLNLGVIVGVVVVSVCGMMLLIGVFIWVLRRWFLKF